MRIRKGDYLDIALDNLKTARNCLSINESSATAFYSQQCIEKTFKFYIENLKDETDLKTHNLRTLYRRVVKTLPKLSKYKEEIGDVSDYYFNTLYPGDDYYKPTKLDAQNAYTAAEAVFLQVYNLVDNKEEFPINFLTDNKQKGTTSFF